MSFRSAPSAHAPKARPFRLAAGLTLTLALVAPAAAPAARAHAAPAHAAHRAALLAIAHQR